ncbi:MAG: hypothetical protein ACTHU0_36865 [Kofleriaceae bacterium]
MDRRQELLGWIAETQRTQRRIGVVVGVLAVLSLGLFAWKTSAAVLALFFVASIGVISYWVTAAHNAAHRAKLEEIDRAERRKRAPESPQTGGHRRWRTQ